MCYSVWSLFMLSFIANSTYSHSHTFLDLIPSLKTSKIFIHCLLDYIKFQHCVIERSFSSILMTAGKHRTSNRCEAYVLDPLICELFFPTNQTD